MQNAFKTIIFLIFLLVISVSCPSCNFKIYKGEHSFDKLDKLADWMTGSFSSEKQSILDSNYYHINLEMVRIWREKDDGIWLYVEQAVGTMPEKPYRQRIYQLTSTGCDNQYRSKVYTFLDPLRMAGAFRDPESFDTLKKNEIIEKPGCHIDLLYDDCEFKGATTGISCESQLRGASYATAAVHITKYELRSWDRGFNALGEQVWGAETGPYVFEKIMNYKID